MMASFEKFCADAVKEEIKIKHELQSFEETAEICEAMVTKQETPEFNESLKIKDYGLEESLDEIKGENVMKGNTIDLDLIKQETKEICFDSVPVSYDDNRIEGNWTQKMDIKEEIKDEDIKNLLSDFTNLDEFKTTKDLDCTGGENWSQTVKIERDIKEEGEYVKTFVSDLTDLDQSKTIGDVEDCKDTVSKSVTESVSSSKEYKCLHCTYQTNVRHSFLTHLKVKHDENAEKFSCTECSYKTKYRHCLLEHTRRRHDKSIMYKCKVCNYETRYKRSLLEHNVTKHHSKTLLYVCRHCDYETKYKNAMKAHKDLQHSNDIVVYRCTKCNFATKYKHGLKNHDKIKHGKDTVIFRCISCPFETKYKSHLNRHNRERHNNEAKSE